MAWTKVKTAVVVGVSILIAVGISVVTAKKIQNYSHESQPQQPIFRIAPNGSIRVVTPDELSRARLSESSQSNQPKGQVVRLDLKTGDTRDVVIRQLEQIHATILKDSPELLHAEFEKTPQNPRPMQIKFSFVDGKLNVTTFVVPKKDEPESSLFPPSTNILTPH